MKNAISCFAANTRRNEPNRIAESSPLLKHFGKFVESVTGMIRDGARDVRRTGAGYCVSLAATELGGVGGLARGSMKI